MWHHWQGLSRGVFPICFDRRCFNKLRPVHFALSYDFFELSRSVIAQIDALLWVKPPDFLCDFFDAPLLQYLAV